MRMVLMFSVILVGAALGFIFALTVVTPLFALLNDPLSIIPSVLYDVVDFHVRIRYLALAGLIGIGIVYYIYRRLRRGRA
jgi:type II secretory pathway component PulF